MITLRKWLSDGPYALALSAGYFGFFAHAGLLSVLEEQGLVPSSASGSSAGALISGLWASGLGCSQIRDELFRLERQDFWDPSPGLGLLSGDLFHKKLKELLRADTFENTSIPLTISVFDLLARKTKVLRSGELCSAIAASCSLPILFQPTRIAGKLYIDGGVLDRPGLQGVELNTRVLYHHLASKSPWRTFGPFPSERTAMVAIVVKDLPRVSPFRLEVGQFAYYQARNQMKYALDREIPEGSGTMEI
jgi:NTE family protein